MYLYYKNYNNVLFTRGAFNGRLPPPVNKVSLNLLIVQLVNTDYKYTKLCSIQINKNIYIGSYTFGMYRYIYMYIHNSIRAMFKTIFIWKKIIGRQTFAVDYDTPETDSYDSKHWSAQKVLTLTQWYVENSWFITPFSPVI